MSKPIYTSVWFCKDFDEWSPLGNTNLPICFDGLKRFFYLDDTDKIRFVAYHNRGKNRVKVEKHSEGRQTILTFDGYRELLYPEVKIKLNRLLNKYKTNKLYFEVEVK